MTKLDELEEVCNKVFRGQGFMIQTIGHYKIKTIQVMIGKFTYTEVKETWDKAFDTIITIMKGFRL